MIAIEHLTHLKIYWSLLTSLGYVPHHRDAVIKDVRTNLMIRGLRVLLGVCCSVALAAASEFVKPAPDLATQPYRNRLETVVKEHYPQLWTDRIEGMPVVTLLFEPDGSVARTKLEIRPHQHDTLTVSEEDFNFYGYGGRLRYIGEARVELPVNTVIVLFGGLDSSDLDRALVEHYFPQALKQGAPPNEGIWILFTHEGRVLRTGEESFDTRSLRSLLEKRYPGIQTSDMSLTPVIGGDGRPIKSASGQALQLHSVWLAAGSPMPEP